MAAQTDLTPKHWELILELLERERGELPAEIRRCRIRQLREQLCQREQTVKELIERVRGMLQACGTY